MTERTVILDGDINGPTAVERQVSILWCVVHQSQLMGTIPEPHCLRQHTGDLSQSCDFRDDMVWRDLTVKAST